METFIDSFTQFLGTYGMISLILVLLFVTVLLLYLYLKKRSEDYYQIGYDKGRKIMRSSIAKGLWKEIAGSSEVRVKQFQERVFNIGFSKEVSEYQREINVLEKRKNDIEIAAQSQSHILGTEYQENKRRLEHKIQSLEQEIERQQGALFQLQREEDKKMQQSSHPTERKSLSSSFFGGVVNATQNAIAPILARVEKDLLLYGYLLIALLLFVGDYFITYYIFSDILKVQVGNTISFGFIPPIELTYIFSGVVALVFVVLAGFLLEFLEKNQKKYTNIIRVLTIYAILVIGILMLIAYFLIIAVPVMKNYEGRVIDILLRVLFVPLIFVVALMIHKIRQESGFGFLFTPIKLIILPISLIVFYLASGVEIVLRYIIQYLSTSAKPARKETLQEISMLEADDNLRSKLHEKRSILVSLVTNFENKKQTIETDFRLQTEVLEQKREEYATRIRLLHSGCDNAVITNLKLQD